MKFDLVHPKGKSGWSEWYIQTRKGSKECCCDCDLVHDLEYKIVDGEIYQRSRRNERLTKSQRKKKK